MIFVDDQSTGGTRWGLAAMFTPIVVSSLRTFRGHLISCLGFKLALRYAHHHSSNLSSDFAIYFPPALRQTGKHAVKRHRWEFIISSFIGDADVLTNETTDGLTVYAIYLLYVRMAKKETHVAYYSTPYNRPVFHPACSSTGEMTNPYIRGK